MIMKIQKATYPDNWKPGNENAFNDWQFNKILSRPINFKARIENAFRYERLRLKAGIN